MLEQGVAVVEVCVSRRFLGQREDVHRDMCFYLGVSMDRS